MPRKKREFQIFNNPLAAQRASATLRAEGFRTRYDRGTKRRGPKLTWWP
jgi:hypothetical protein